MKKNFFCLAFLFSMATSMWAKAPQQFTIEGPFPSRPSKTQLATAAGGFTKDDVEFWVGEGSNETVLVLQWNIASETNALAWGYRWDGEEVSGEDLLCAVAKADPRFVVMMQTGTEYGSAIGGFGYDADGDGEFSVGKDDQVFVADENGIIDAGDYGFDGYTSVSAGDYWQGGWYDGYWSYWVKETQAEDWGYSGYGATGRILTPDCWDGWNFSVGMNPQDWKPIVAAPKPVLLADYSNGMFFVNEDWYGHDNGSINFLSNTGEWTYRVYKKENPGLDLGATSQFATIYGGKMYICSKQGNRLVVCDAQTMKSIKVIENIALNETDQSADSRAFLGVDTEKAYLSTSDGIFVIDIVNNEIAAKVTGTEGQVGNMIRVNDYVYAVTLDALLVIDADTDAVVETILGPKDGETQLKLGSIVLSKDGNLWLSVATNGGGGTAPKLMKLDPKTHDVEVIEIPDGIYAPANSWYAWTADGFCASNQNNCLYWNGGASSWFSGTAVMKYDIDNNMFSKLIDLSSTDFSIYGSSLRIDPVSDELVLGLFEGFASTNYKTVCYDSNGTLVQEYPMEEHYWFPALPVFTDNAAPIAADMSALQIPGDVSYTLDLGAIVSDDDNATAAIVKTVSSVSDTSVLDAEVENGELVITPIANGTASVTIAFNSNGKVVEQTVDVTVDIASGNEELGATKLLVYSLNGTLVVGGLEVGTSVVVYGMDGTMLFNGVSTAATEIIALPTNRIVVVKVGKQTIKTMIK